MRVVLAGLRARRGAAVATLLLAVLAIGVAMVGPMYASSASEHLLDTTLAEDETVTMLSAQLPALPSRVTEIEGVPLGQVDVPPADSVLDDVTVSMESSQLDEYWGRPIGWLLDKGGFLTANSWLFNTALYWHEDMCELAEVEGRCPEAAGEALIDPEMAKSLGVGVGDTVALSFPALAGQDPGQGGGGGEADPGRREFTVVGTYELPHDPDRRWGDPLRMAGNPQLLHAASSDTQPGEDASPALLVSQESMTGPTFVAGADRLIDLGAVNLDTMRDAERIGDAANSQFLAESDDPAGNWATFDIGPAVDEADTGSSALSRVTAAAVAPLVVLALLLLYALVAAGAETRRPQVALARLRGQRRGQVVRFALAEPVTIAVVAVPLGIALAAVSGWGIARAWLGDDVPVSFNWASVAAGLVVLLGVLVAAAAAVTRVLREPLARSLGTGGAPTGVSRWGLVLRSAALVLAVAVVAQLTLSDGAGDDGDGVLGLLAPILVALAAAVVAGWVLLSGARVWIRRTAVRAGTARFLAARRLGRRPEVSALVTPLVLATVVATFATSTWIIDDDSKVSRAYAEVGADRSFATSATPERLLRVTHDADPDGRYLAAVVLQTDGDDTARQVMVDTDRLDTVAAWDDSWSDSDIAELQRDLAPRGAVDPVTFTGRRISLTLEGVDFERGISGRPHLELDYLDDDGEPASAFFGAMHDGELTAAVKGCRDECVVQQFAVTGDARSTTTAQGAFTVREVSVDGEPADWRFDNSKAWRPARPYAATPSDPPLELEATGSGLRVSVYLDELPAASNGQSPPSQSGIAAFTPDDVPEVLPALLTDDTEAEGMPPPQSGIGETYDENVFAGNALNQTPTPLRLVERVRALPGIGSEGVLVDLGASLRQPAPTGAALTTRLWVAAGTPAEVLDRVRDAGIGLSGEERVDDVVAEQRADAFSLGWRVFLLVAVLTLLLAVVGVYAAATTQRRWRAFETASMLAVLVKRRALLVAALLEHAVLVALVVVIGLLAGWGTLRLVLPGLDLGGGEAYEPPPDLSARWPVLIAIGIAVFLLATVVATSVAARTIRRTTPAELPWDEQQL